MNILATICMRKGSKGIPNKNLIKINNKPLLYFTIKQALNSKIFDEVIVSTDSQKIANLSNSYGAKCWFIRPKYLSDDNSAKIPAIRHALLKSEKYFDKKFDTIVDLDASSPLRTVNDIKNAYQKFSKEKKNNLITVNQSRKNPYFNIIEYQGKKLQIVKKYKYLTRRQDAPITYDMNASIYIWKKNFLLNSNNILTNNTSVYEMPFERSIDIDTKDDLKIVRLLMKRYKFANG